LALSRRCHSSTKIAGHVVTAIYARMFDEKREAVLAVEKAVLPLMPARAVLAA
jgi:hypothetical protein